MRVAPVRLRDGFAARRLGSPTKRSGDSNEIESVILVGYWRGTPSARGLAKIALTWKADTRSALGFGGGVGPQSWSEPRLADVGPGLQRAQTAVHGEFVIEVRRGGDPAPLLLSPMLGKLFVCEKCDFSDGATAGRTGRSPGNWRDPSRSR
jgi:hypothetical protein